MAGEKTQTVLFLCTGNYYRSRFAEVLFNHWARETLPKWWAKSGALALERGILNYGPVSPVVPLGLEALGVEYEKHARPPRQVTEADLEEAELLIGLKESEHRPLIEERYPEWAELVEYWHIDDMDKAAPAKTMRDIEEKVEELIERLGK